MRSLKIVSLSLASLLLLMATAGPAAAEVGDVGVADCTGPWVDQVVCLVAQFAGDAIDVGEQVVIFLANVLMGVFNDAIDAAWAIVVIVLGLVDDAGSLCERLLGPERCSASWTLGGESLP